MASREELAHDCQDVLVQHLDEYGRVVAYSVNGVIIYRRDDLVDVPRLVPQRKRWEREHHSTRRYHAHTGLCPRERRSSLRDALKGIQKWKEPKA